MNIIEQDMENLYWMSGDEKYSVWDEKYSGLVLFCNSNRLDIIEEKTSELDDITMKLSRMKYIEKRLSVLWNIKWPHICNWSPRRRRKGQKNIFEEVMAENFPNLRKTLNSGTLWSLVNPK